MLQFFSRFLHFFCFGIAVSSLAFGANVHIKKPTEAKFGDTSLVSELIVFFDNKENRADQTALRDLLNRIVNVTENAICKTQTGEIICAKFLLKAQNRAHREFTLREALLASLRIEVSDDSALSPQIKQPAIELTIRIDPRSLDGSTFIELISKKLFESIDLKENFQSLIFLTEFLNHKGYQLNSCAIANAARNADFFAMASEIRSTKVANQILTELGINPNTAAQDTLTCTAAIKIARTRIGIINYRQLQLQSDLNISPKYCNFETPMLLDQAIEKAEEKVISSGPARPNHSVHESICEFLIDDELFGIESQLYDELFKIKTTRPKIYPIKLPERIERPKIDPSPQSYLKKLNSNESRDLKFKPRAPFS